MVQYASNLFNASFTGHAIAISSCFLSILIVSWPTAGNAADWEFDENKCPAPSVGYEITDIPVPHAMIMLDRSGSMDGTISVPCTQYQCTYQGSWKRHGCYMDVTIEEDDFWNDDEFHFQGYEECWDCRSDQDCRDNVRNFYGDYIREHGDGWWAGGGEWGGVDDWDAADHRILESTYSNTTLNCRTCRTEEDCAQAFRDWKGIDYSSDYTAIPSENFRAVSCGSSISDTKWNIASDALNTVVTDLTAADPDTIEFGLGLFWGYDSATIETNAWPNNRDDIVRELYGGNNPSGGTPILDAIETMHRSSTIQNAPGVGAGILVTDGMHSGRGSPADVVAAACAHANDGPLYVVGFGGQSNEKFNNVLAAAGGTGYGCNRASLCRHPNRWDWSRFYDDCKGAKLAESPAALQLALSEIVDEISCTFPVDVLSNSTSPYDWDEPRQGCDADYYNCLKIQLGNTRVHHISSPTGNPGWEFSNSNHDTIRLLNTQDGASANYCDMVRNQMVDLPGDNNDVRIKRSCMCVESTGNSCGASQMAPPPQTCECPQGDWVCNRGIDTCLPRVPCVNDAGNTIPATGTGGTCTVGTGACQRSGAWYCDAGGSRACSATPGEPQAEICDGLDNDCGGVADELPGADDGYAGTLVGYGDLCHVDFVDNPGPAEDAAMSVETTRCMLGVRGCFDGANTCEPLAKMPEVCNGLDDDCDERIDNLNNSWNNPDFADKSLTGVFKPAACYERNICTCPNGPADITRGDYTSNFTHYLEAWYNNNNPTCSCGAGLSP
jgi:hypothetical protein